MARMFTTLIGGRQPNGWYRNPFGWHGRMQAMLAGAVFFASAGSATSQAVMSDQRDALAHMVNAALAAEQCGMQVNEEMLEATLSHAGLARADLGAEPFSSTVAELTDGAQKSLQEAGAATVCKRLETMYGPTGQRVPGLLAQ